MALVSIVTGGPEAKDTAWDHVDGRLSHVWGFLMCSRSGWGLRREQPLRGSAQQALDGAEEDGNL